MDSHFFILLQAILRLILLCKAKGRSGKILDIVCTDTFSLIELPANNLRDAQCFVFITPESIANPVIINLSNLDSEVDDILAMCCKLDVLWRDASLKTCQKLQNRLFPNGILWDKEKDNYRTFDKNEVLSIIT